MIDEEGNQKTENEGDSLVANFNDTDEFDLFDLEAVTEIIQYKWNKYGMRFHLFGFFVHCYYAIMINIYVAHCYKYELSKVQRDLYILLLFIGIIYTWLYDFI